MNTTEEMEQPAKNWQVSALSDQLKAQSELIKNVSTKLDALIAQPHITDADVDRKIAAAEERIEAKYAPVADNAKWTNRILVAAVLGLLANIGFQFWKG